MFNCRNINSVQARSDGRAGPGADVKPGLTWHIEHTQCASLTFGKKTWEESFQLSILQPLCLACAWTPRQKIYCLLSASHQRPLGKMTGGADAQSLSKLNISRKAAKGALKKKWFVPWKRVQRISKVHWSQSLWNGEIKEAEGRDIIGSSENPQEKRVLLYWLILRHVTWLGNICRDEHLVLTGWK